jgi:hypothetical protein
VCKAGEKKHRGGLWVGGEKRVREVKKERTWRRTVPTRAHGCASQSTCSLSREQSWSHLPEAGGKGQAGPLAHHGEGAWAPKDSEEWS